MRKPFGLLEVIKINTGIDILQLPFFPPDENFSTIYPEQERKKEMAKQLAIIKEHFDKTDEIELLFTEKFYREYFLAERQLLHADFARVCVNPDRSLSAVIPRDRPVPLIQDDPAKNGHDNFMELINRFSLLIEGIITPGNGYYYVVQF